MDLFCCYGRVHAGSWGEGDLDVVLFVVVGVGISVAAELSCMTCFFEVFDFWQGNYPIYYPVHHGKSDILVVLLQ